MKTFYITTTLPYANAKPHMGHALEFVRADVIARVKKLDGYSVFFNTGIDEHGSKVHKTAVSLGIDPQKYVDDLSMEFKKILPLLGIGDDVNFTRTSSESHKKSAHAFWNLCKKNGFIYKKNYKIKYCVGCELEKTDSELVGGKCPIHPLMDIEEIDEENYFFKFSEFQKP
ncbi:MAG TPA: class I tRNA ligase family protein, partial [Candidatus Paceibacterota bacterium]